MQLTLVDVGGVGLLTRLGALLLLTGGGGLLAGILLLRGLGGSSRGLGGGLLVGSFGRHFEGGKRTVKSGVCECLCEMLELDRYPSAVSSSGRSGRWESRGC